jgi:hypothetical protein
MTKLYLASIPFTLDANTMAEAGYDTASTHDLEARRDLKDVIVRGLHAFIESGSATEHDLILCKAVLCHKEVTALKVPRSPRSIPIHVLETMIHIDHRERLEPAAHAIARHGINYEKVGNTLRLIDAKSRQSLGLYSETEVWALAHLLDGIYDRALLEGL